MHITYDWTSSAQKTVDLITTIAPACIVHEKYAELWERLQKLIELLPITPKQTYEWSKIRIEMSVYDIEKMRLIKQRMQLVKELITTYSTIQIDRKSCVQSSIPSSPYVIMATYHKWNILFDQQLSTLESFYIRQYHILSTLLLWRSKTMWTAPLGSWESLLGSKTTSSSKRSRVLA